MARRPAPRRHCTVHALPSTTARQRPTGRRRIGAGDRDLSSPNLTGVDRFAFDPRTVEKPWGSELIWARPGDYAGKILFVKAGESLSLQFHNEKDESWYVLEGARTSSSARRGRGSSRRR